MVLFCFLCYVYGIISEKKPEMHAGGGHTMRRKYIITLSIIISIVFIVIIYYYLFSLRKISDIYLEKTKETILELNKDFLKDNVNNLICEIDSARKTRKQYMDDLVRNTSSIIHLKKPVEINKFDNFFINFFMDQSSTEIWTVLIWDKKEDKVIYDTQNLAASSWADTLRSIQSDLSSYRLIEQGDHIAVFGISKSYIDKLVKLEIADRIRNLKFDGESYIWVNEILNYEGGKNYAIRRIHPTLTQTEGMYLSTDMTDIKGNLPYLTEIQGINKEGEVFFSYYFKEKYNNKVSEKLTYAKLYKDFDWVIAMGIYEKDLQSYINQTNKESESLVSKLTLNLVLLFLIILIVSYSLIFMIEQLYYRYSKRLLESEANQDTLTKAESRRSGTKDLIRAFKDYKKNGSNACIMMFDIDFFKSINDTKGHDVGDLVLVEIVTAIQEVIRSSDRIIRWGGDEFIIIFYGLTKKYALTFGENILSVVSSLRIPTEEEEINTTVSIGFSYFIKTDSDYTEVLKRADQALYKSKIGGRNQVNII